MRIVDSRRLTGPSLWLDQPGAILDVALDGISPEAAEEAWRAALAKLLSEFGWGAVQVAARTHAQGMSLAFTAPLDQLYAATEINEAAWHMAARALGADAAVVGEVLETETESIARVRAAIAGERRPWLQALAAQAAERGVTLLTDDKRLSLGLGTGSFSWPIEETPQVLRRIPWAKVHDIPTAFVTGTNGKTTSVRLLGAIATAAGKVAGMTSTDRVTVAGETVAEGDYSGPNGARTVLRDRRVEIGLLEVARGGLLRRGVPLTHVRVALVTNVANDHLGEYGVFDLETLADVKLVVAKALAPEGRLVLNADDPLLLERGERYGLTVLWFTLDPRHSRVTAHVSRGGEACMLDGDELVFARGMSRHVIARVADVPIALGGAARHNIANALGAIGVATVFGFSDSAIAEGLAAFASSPEQNPGRANVWRLGDVTAIVDFAHNPHGLAALVHMAKALPATRRAIVIGQAGDRSDEDIAEFARGAWALEPAHVFIKELETYLRGREFGVVPALLGRELRSCGATADALSQHPDELSAVRAALTWAKPGDQLVLTTHAQREEVVALLETLVRRGWTAGERLG